MCVVWIKRYATVCKMQASCCCEVGLELPDDISPSLALVFKYYLVICMDVERSLHTNILTDKRHKHTPEYIKKQTL